MKKALYGSRLLLLIFALAFIAEAQEKPDTKAQELLDKGKGLIAQMRFDEAILALDEAINLKPELPALHHQLGRAYANKFFATRDAQLETKARMALKRAVELDPLFAEAYYTAGRIDEFNHQYQDARANYERAIKADPTLVKAYGEKWRTMLKRTDFETEIPAIRAEIESLLKRSESRESALAAAALGCEIIGDEKGLMDAQEKFIAEFPNSEKTQDILIERVFEEKDRQKQTTNAQAFIARYPQTPALASVRHLIFINRIAQGDVSDDELIKLGEALIKALPGDPNSMGYVRSQVIIAFAERRLALDRAKELADETVKYFDEMKPDSPLLDRFNPSVRNEVIKSGREQSHRSRGFVLIRLGKAQEAAKELKPEFDPVIKEVERTGFVLWKDMDLRSVGARPRVLWLAELCELEGDYERAAKYLLAGYGDDEHANQFIRERLPVVYKKLGRPDPDATAALNTSKTRYLSMSNSSSTVDEDAKKRLLAERISTPAPDFKVTKLDRKEVRLSDLKGKVAVLNFWATWCGPCIAEMPHFQKVVDKYKNQSDVVFLAISIDENRPAVRPFLEKNGYTMSVAYDSTAAELFKIDSVPMTFIVDRKGVIQFSDEGFGGDGKDYFERLVWRVDALLKEGSAAPSPKTIKERKND
jgi:thiol-disulfide isomerase/thioredoxin/Tfp pilus assembly protein PilF